MTHIGPLILVFWGAAIALKASLLLGRYIKKRRSNLTSPFQEGEIRAADCSCGYHVEGADADELFDQLQIHIDQAHPEEEFTDDQIADLLANNSYTVVVER